MSGATTFTQIASVVHARISSLDASARRGIELLIIVIDMEINGWATLINPTTHLAVAPLLGRQWVHWRGYGRRHDNIIRDKCYTMSRARQTRQGAFPRWRWPKWGWSRCAKTMELWSAILKGPMVYFGRGPQLYISLWIQKLAEGFSSSDHGGDDKSPWKNSCTQAGHAHNRSFAHDQALLTNVPNHPATTIEDNGNHSLYLSHAPLVFFVARTGGGLGWWRRIRRFTPSWRGLLQWIAYMRPGCFARGRSTVAAWDTIKQALTASACLPCLWARWVSGVSDWWVGPVALLHGRARWGIACGWHGGHLCRHRGESGLAWVGLKGVE